MARLGSADHETPVDPLTCKTLLVLSVAALAACASQPVDYNGDTAPRAAAIVPIKSHRPLVALALGSGGTRGFAHVGVIKALEEARFVVGGTANSISTLSHTQGWLHCDIPGTDASGVVKAMMDELIDDFRNCRMPNRVHITTSCCQINCGGQGDHA